VPGFTAWVMALLVAVAPAMAAAWDFTGTKQIVAVTRDGERLPLGRVSFEPRGEGQATFRVVMDTPRFTDHFLSMREFKCLEGPRELVCHVPYPHAQPGVIGTAGKPGDLAWLEHNLMFFFKAPADFGARLWNGLYFQLSRSEQGLVGTPQSIDLNRIGAPPARADQAPFGPALRDPVPAGVRWIESLRIE
jgi:hypothetical protein